MDDYFEDFDKVLPSMQVVPGMGIIVPMSKSGKVAFLGIENPEKISRVETKTGDFNQNYATFKYAKPEDDDSNKKIVFTIRDVIQCDTERSDQYVMKIAQDCQENDGFIAPCKFLLSNHAFGTGAEDPSFQMLSFKQPIVCGSNLMNQQIFAQQLRNESL